MKQNVQYIEQLLHLYWDRYSYFLVVLALIALFIMYLVASTLLGFIF